MRYSSLLAAVTVVCALAGSSARAQVAVYEWWSGQVVFDQLDGQVGITLIGEGISFNTDDFNGFGQINDTALANAAPQAKLAWSNFGGFEGGPFSSGSVLPTPLETPLFNPWSIFESLSVEMTSIGEPIDVLPKFIDDPPSWDARGFYFPPPAEPRSALLTAIAVAGLVYVRWRRKSTRGPLQQTSGKGT